LSSELNVLALIKGEERYVFVYDDDSQPQLLDAIRDSASSPDLSLSWFDALVLTKKAREQEAARVADDTAMPSRSRI
jgi:hypothetical protein